MRKPIPGVLWIAIISLSLMVLGKIIAVFTISPAVLVDVAFSGGLLYGILARYKWAYWATIGLTLLGTILSLSNGIATAMIVFAVDCLVLIPVLVSKDYFWSFPQPSSQTPTPCHN